MKNLNTLTKKKISFFFVLILSIVFLHNVKSADYYWVGDGGNWSDFGTHWATTSGGAVFHVQIPTALDNVYFDANSFTIALQTVNIDVDIDCHNMDWTAVTNNPTFDGPSMMRISGSLALSPSLSFPYMNGIDFTSNSHGNTIDFAGIPLLFWGLNFMGSGDWTLMSDVDMSAAGGMIWINNGILKTNGYTLDLGGLNGNMTPTAGLELGSSTVNLQWFWFMQPFQFDAGTSTINLESNIFQGNGYTWANVNLVPTFPGGAWIQGSTVFDTLTFNALVDNISFENNTIQELKDMQISSDCANPVTIISDGEMSYIKKTFGIVNLDYVNVRNMTIIGGATFISDFSSDIGNVVNWTINSPVPVNYYWVNGTGTWNDPNRWSLSSGGDADSSCIPSAVDNVFFDANSFTAPGQVVTINSGAVCNNMDWTGVTNLPDLNGGWPGYLGINGSLTLDAGMTYNFNGQLIFVSQNPGKTITTAGVSLLGQINFEGSGEWTLMDAFTTTGQITFNQGSLITNNNAFSISSFLSNGALSRNLNLGSSLITVSGSWQIQNGANFTIIPGTSTIDFNGSWFMGADLTYNNINFNNTSNTYIFGSNTFNVMSINNGGSILLEINKTQTVQDISLSGNCANWSKISSTSAGITSSISTAAGIINVNFAKIQDISAIGGATFNANNSIDFGNNTGWNFTPPVATTYYWIADNGNWSDPAHWSLSSGGAPAGCIPSEIDNVVFDDNSGVGGVNITINVNAGCNDIDFSASTSARNLYGVNPLNIFGSMLFSNTVNTSNYSGDIYFKSNNPGENINTLNRRIYSNVYFDGNGDWTLLGNFTLNILSTPYRSIYLNKGTLNTNGFQVIASGLYSWTENVRQLILGNSTFNVTNSTFRL